MEVSELRINNLILRGSEIRIVSFLDETYIGLSDVYREKRGMCLVSDVSPILLTEDLLLKFDGFEERYKGMFGSFVAKRIGSLEFQFGRECAMTIKKDQCGIIFNFKNITVHKFQNVYYELVGEELGIDLRE